jgi:hypothetical protein
MEKITFDEERMLEALQRSGYLFESEISKLLTEKDYFVESNKIITDHFTGKGREIDLIAECYGNLNKVEKCISKSILVFEIKNLSAPLILMTEFHETPNVESYYAIKEYITKPEGIEYYRNTFYNHFLEDRFVFTQYCSFQEKKDKKAELMALHPENIYQGLQKIVQYCDEQTGDPDAEYQSEYFRHFYYIPILLISDDLFELHLADGNVPKFVKVESSILMYKYQVKEEPNLAYIFVTTKNGLLPLLDKIRNMEVDTEEEMIKQKKRNVT